MSRKKKDESPAGGVVYFLSIIFLFVLSALLTLSFIIWVFSKAHFPNWCAFIICALLGYIISHYGLRGRFSVFVHEFKHKLTSGLAGNKPKSLSVGDNEGAFEYEYTKHTAHLNAFIALAPYYVPLFSAVAIAAIYLFQVQHEVLRAAIVGVTYGGDLSFNTRDISPHQSDFSELRGGYKIGILYVTLMNFVLLIFLGSWISGGKEGVLGLLGGALLILHEVVVR